MAIAGLTAPLMAASLIADRRAAAPCCPPAGWRFPLLRHGTIGAFLNTAATSSAMTLAALYLQRTRHDSPLAAAVTLGAVQPCRGRRPSHRHARPAPDRGPMVTDGATFRPN